MEIPRAGELEHAHDEQQDQGEDERELHQRLSPPAETYARHTLATWVNHHMSDPSAIATP